MEPIATGGDLKVNEPSIRRLSKTKTPKKAKRNMKPGTAKKTAAEAKRPAVGTLTRTKSLLLAALRVWELKQGIRE
jgi:hypothetical protein